MATGTTRSTYRHRLPVRIMHWTNVVCLFVLIGSGLQIFLAHPALYWATPQLRQARAFAQRQPRCGRQVARHHAGRFAALRQHRRARRLDNMMGKRVARAFPTWATIPGARNLAQGRRWHFFFAWLFVINGLAYWLWSWRARHLRDDLLPTAANCAASAIRSSSTRSSGTRPASRRRATTCCRSWPTWR
jgi:thiosulfate reductase cytochrome b subunit